MRDQQTDWRNRPCNFSANTCRQFRSRSALRKRTGSTRSLKQSATRGCARVGCWTSTRRRIHWRTNGTVKQWRDCGRLAAHLCNDWGECLYEWPTCRRNRKGGQARLWSETGPAHPLEGACAADSRNSAAPGRVSEVEQEPLALSLSRTTGASDSAEWRTKLASRTPARTNTFAVEPLLAHASMEDVSALLGHSSVQAMERYTLRGTGVGATASRESCLDQEQIAAFTRLECRERAPLTCRPPHSPTTSKTNTRQQDAAQVSLGTQ